MRTVVQDSTVEYEIDSKNNLVERRFWVKYYGLKHRIKYRYDDKNNLEAEVYYNKEGKVYRVFYYRYGHRNLELNLDQEVKDFEFNYSKYLESLVEGINFQ